LPSTRGKPGPAEDISHCNTPTKVSGHAADDLEGALRGCDVVVIPAGVPRKPGMTRDDLFNTARDAFHCTQTHVAKKWIIRALHFMANALKPTSIPMMAFR
jgi:malate/lactate dehydrogenase